MKRKALLKAGNDFVVLEESRFEAGTQLQEALKLNCEVIPVSDLDLAGLSVSGWSLTRDGPADWSGLLGVVDGSSEEVDLRA